MGASTPTPQRQASIAASPPITHGTRSLGGGAGFWIAVSMYCCPLSHGPTPGKGCVCCSAMCGGPPSGFGCILTARERGIVEEHDIPLADGQRVVVAHLGDLVHQNRFPEVREVHRVTTGVARRRGTASLARSVCRSPTDISFEPSA